MSRRVPDHAACPWRLCYTRYCTAAAISTGRPGMPVVVIIDDIDHLEHELAVTLVENLIGRPTGQVMVAATADPGSKVAATLRSEHGMG